MDFRQFSRNDDKRIIPGLPKIHLHAWLFSNPRGKVLFLLKGVGQKSPLDLILLKTCSHGLENTHACKWFSRNNTYKVLYIKFSFLENHFEKWEIKFELFIWQPTLTAAIWIICMTTNTDGYHMDMKFKRNVLNHFSFFNVIPQKTKFNIECLICKNHGKLSEVHLHPWLFSNSCGKVLIIVEISWSPDLRVQHK